MKACIFGKQVEIKTEAAVIIISVLVLLGCLVGYVFFRDDSDIIIESAAVTDSTGTGLPGQELPKSTGSVDASSAGSTDAAETDGIEDGKAAAGTEQIKVYVVGCVKEPGIVTLEKGQLIDDAVRLAGGLTEQADAGSINMVYKLEENLMLYIKSKKELEPQPQNQVEKTLVKNTAANGSLGKGAVIIKDSGESVEVVGDTEDGENEEGNASRVNINTADEDELDTLPGVGEVTARDIIAFREKNGPFRKIEDIMKVPRIKQSRFDNVKEFITVE
ncbi:MAG: helix-hairpin-helix domain-containing protein [Clostridiaceae bacterium]